MDKITSIHQLKELSRGQNLECFIALAGGLVRSSKVIFFDEEKDIFYVTNEIDDSEQELTDKELFTKSNVGNAILKGALYIW